MIERESSLICSTIIIPSMGSMSRMVVRDMYTKKSIRNRVNKDCYLHTSEVNCYSFDSVSLHFNVYLVSDFFL